MTNKKKILVVEDEKPLLMAIKSKLELGGYDVVFAEDGESGEKAIKDEKPDLVLLDILLPKKSGIEILEDLRKDKNDVLVMIISNSGQPVEIDKAMKLGVKDYLVKADFSPEEVIEKVRKIIGPGSFDEPKEDQKEQKVNGVGEVKPKGTSVLIVEDDEFLREVIAQKLIKEGFVVQSVTDADNAFELIKKKVPQIILLDLILPGMDGFEILAQLKKNPSTEAIPVIVLSNLGQKEDVERAMSAGAIDYLVKANFTPGEIVQKIREAIGKKYL